MKTSVKTWLGQILDTFEGWRALAELSRVNDARLRDMGIERGVAGLRGDVPWQAAEQGGSGAKVQLHYKLAA